MTRKATFAVITAFLGGADAFWRMECPGRSGLARIDPIMMPDAAAAHVHAISGSSGKISHKSLA